MEKGQASIDLLLSLIAALAFFSVLLVYTNTNISAHAENIYAGNWAKAILLDSYAATGAVKAYGFVMSYKSPAPEVQRTANAASCTIDLIGVAPGFGWITVRNYGTSTLPTYNSLTISDVNFAGGLFGLNTQCGKNFNMGKK